MRIVTGDLLNAPERIIAHVVNCMGVMGGGVALQIRKKYPEVYTEYKEFCDNKRPDGGKEDNRMYTMLGVADFVETRDHTFVYNLFAQFNYGTEKRQLDYDALTECLNDMCQQINTYANFRDVEKKVAIPYMIGCGLAGGDWSKVCSIIETVEAENGIEFIAYKLR